MVNSSYLTKVVDVRQLPRTVTKLARLIEKYPHEFDAIAIRGMSGALVAPMLCRRIKKHLIVCRKESEKSHGAAVEGWLLPGGRYIIIDDFMASGTTVRGIVQAIDEWVKSQNSFRTEKLLSIDPVAVYLYNEDSTWNDITVRENRNLSILLPIYHYMTGKE